MKDDATPTFGGLVTGTDKPIHEFYFDYSEFIQGYRNETSQWVGGRRSHGTSDVSNVSSERAQGRQITVHPVPRRQP